jgi:SAM-dependent methyltransferase
MSSRWRDYAWRLLGHSSSAALQAVRLLSARRAAGRRALVDTAGELDRTGIIVKDPVRLPLRWQDEQVIFPFYEESLAHSFWRAQEFSLFMRCQSQLQSPVLDFGCGDGSFAAVLFREIDYGVDIDEQALSVARQFGIYKQLLKSTGLEIPLPDGSVGSVFSNSVLEHVKHLEEALAEISRVLRSGGVFIFTVPVAQFARDLQRYFGRRESEQLNRDYFHRNLLEVDQWKQLLGKHGLSPLVAQPYQPAWFSCYYMMFRFLGNHGLGRAFPGIRQKTWKRYGPQLVEMVRRSTDGSVLEGGNLFVIARKT